MSSNNLKAKTIKQIPVVLGEVDVIKSIQLLKDNNVEAIVSAGNTAALLSSSLIMLGKIEKIRRFLSRVIDEEIDYLVRNPEDYFRS